MKTEPIAAPQPDLNDRRILRVFPRKTNATPDDDMVRLGPPGLFDEYYPEVHVSVTFSYDVKKAVALAKAWEPHCKLIMMGGPAMGDRGDEFTPGRYLRPGYTITSRGCLNRCWFCDVWKREGTIRELEIKDGWNILDSNLLACSTEHIEKVFAMLRRLWRPVEFTGGLEAKHLTNYHVQLLAGIPVKQMFFAYDEPDDLEPLIEAGKKLLEVFTFSSKRLRCYVLCGYPGDTIAAAEERMYETVDAGFWPMAMFYRGKGKFKRPEEWRYFQGLWAQPVVMNSVVKKYLGDKYADR